MPVWVMPSFVFISLQPDGEVNCFAQPQVETRLQKRVAVVDGWLVGRGERRGEHAQERWRVSGLPFLQDLVLSMLDGCCLICGCSWLRMGQWPGLWLLFAVYLEKLSGACKELIFLGN